jgi:nucleoside-diphosphate-sugar epimerase
MRVTVVGATGNVGSSLVRTLAADPDIDEVIGLARRPPATPLAGVVWKRADVTDGAEALVPHFRGADTVVHLAWLIQPSRDMEALRSANVGGSGAVFEAAAKAGARSIVYASSVGAYSHGPKDRRVDESWPTDGVPTSFYARHKAEVERMLDRFESEHPEVRGVRLRPGLIFKGEAATEIRRLFLGPFLPNPLVRESLIPVVPDIDRLRVQAVHTDDVADAYLRAIKSDARGAFNIAAEPVIDPPRLASLLRARRVRIPPAALRGAAALSWRLRLQPTPPGWVDMGLAVPLMDTGRARRELGWEPRVEATDALLELLDGIRHGKAYPTPPLDRESSGRLRARELAGGVGARMV